MMTRLQTAHRIPNCLKLGIAHELLPFVPMANILIIVLFCANATAQNLTITEPLDGACISGQYTAGSPLEGGIINGNNFAPDPATISFEYVDNTGNFLDIKVTASSVSPAFEQPPPVLCPDWNFGDDEVAACNGQGYCIFTRECICFNNDDCNAGTGVCTDQGICGCANDQQCGDGQVCNQGECSCADNIACASGQTCLPNGVCSCTTTDDCEGDLICSDGVCNAVGEGLVSFDTISNTSQDNLPRTIVQTIELSQDLQDAEGLALKVDIFDYNLPDPSIVATQSIGFKLDRAFPLLNTTDNCQTDNDCPIVGEACDLVTSRCYPEEEANVGNCRALDDFSQGISNEYEIVDNFDDNPVFTILEVVEDGCLRSQRFLLEDDCGNAQIVSAEGVRAPTPEEVDVELQGYICNASPCAREVSIADGDTASRVNIETITTAPNRCYDYVDTFIEKLTADGTVISSRQLFADEILQALPATILSTREVEGANGAVSISHGGPYQLTADETLLFTLRNGITETFTINEEDYFDLSSVSAIELVISINQQSSDVIAVLDGNDLRLKTRDLGDGVTLDIGGSAASSLGFTPAFDSADAEGSGDGLFKARVELYACGNDVPLTTDLFNFEVSMPFEVTIGGPYSVDEGDELSISAENIFVSPEFGGIARVEWDLDGDGIYERLEDFLSPATVMSSREIDGQIINGGDFELIVNESMNITYQDGTVEAFTALAEDFTNVTEDVITASTSEIVNAINQQITSAIAASEGEDLLTISSIGVGLGTTMTLTGPLASSLGFTSAQGSDFALGTGETVSQLPIEPQDDLDLAEEMLTVVSIDTEEQDELLVSIRITTGEGAALEARANVQIEDISPVCALPQAIYDLREGEVFNFEAPDTVSGGDADPISFYRWSFGDGTDDAENAEPSIQHIYEEEGEYTLTLNAVDEDSECSEAASALVRVGGVAPIIEGIGLDDDTLTPLEGQPITFTSGLTRAGAASDPILEYSWDFGYSNDGQRVTQSGGDVTAPIHVFDNDGDYNVCLSVSDSDDIVGPNCFNITVEDLMPTPVWNADSLQANEGEPVTFNWTGTVAGGVADLLTGVRWSFSDGSAPVDSDLNTPTIQHTFNGDGEFTVRLTAIDEDSEAFFEGRVTILDVSPNSLFDFILPVGATTPHEGVELTLDGSASTPGAPTDQIAAYRWDFGDGSAVQETNGPTINHAWPDGPATYEVQCTVVDSDGSTATSSLQINVENVEPEISISGSESAEVGSETTFSVDVIDVNADLPSFPDSGATVEWDMGDGTLLTGAQVTHTYQSEGTFNITAHFTDGDGGEADATYRFTVDAQLAVLTTISVGVELDQDGGSVEDPQQPIFEFIDNSVEDHVYYLREADEITLDVTITSARLANGIINTASANWIRLPENAQVINEPILPAAGEPREGSEVKRTIIRWRPNFFQAGNYELMLRVVGENGGEFDQTWTFNVAERGTPMLATTSGSLQRGRVVVYRYEKTNDSLSFIPNREVNVGQGAYDIIADDDRHRLFVSSPLSGHVAVLGGDPIRLLRRIPTGAGAYDMDWGGGFIWVVNTENNSLSAIDPNTLKVRKTLILTGIERPLAVAYVSSETFNPRVIVACGRTGKLLVIDANGALAGEGEQAIEHVVSLGGSLTQMEQRDDQIWVVDGKLRSIFKGSINTLVQTGNASAFSQIEGIPFAASDITTTDRGLWVATGDSLSLVDYDGFIEGYDLAIDRLIEANSLLFDDNQTGLVVSDGIRLEHRIIEDNGDLTESIGIESSRLQKLTNFIQYAE
jgi:YVTN family beta-propeller protein